MDPDITAYYDRGEEAARLVDDPDGVLELVRTQEVLRRHLPPAPADVLDVGGGPGRHADWLADDGFAVHLVDPVALHVEQATALAAGRFTAAVGDARSLEADDASFDAVLLLGPLYHLPDRDDRLAAWREAARVVKPGGIVAAAAISRFASVLDGLRRGFLDDPAFEAVVQDDLLSGAHQNPERRPGWFTTAYFHHPTELPVEIVEAGLAPVEVVAVEGPGWLLPDLDARLADPARRDVLLRAVRAVEAEPSLIGTSAHLLAVARRFD